MMLFALLGGLLVLLALVLLVPPLLKHHSESDREFLRQISTSKAELRKLKAEYKKGKLPEDEYKAKRKALGLTMLDEIDMPDPAEQKPVTGRWAAAVTAILLPALTLGLYFRIGQPNLVTGTPESNAHMAGGTQQNMPPVEEMIAGLEQKLEENPENAEGWFMLGRAYMLIRDYPKAVAAMQKTHQLVGDEPDILMRLADAMAMADDGRVSGEPAKLIDRALAVNPDHGEALWLAGIAAQEVGNPQKAIHHWQRARKTMANDPDSVEMLDQAIAKAQSEVSGTAMTSSAPAPAEPAPAVKPTSAGAVQIQVEVSLAESIRSKASPEDSVFIFARAASGPPMPLAVQRTQVKNLPITVTLDDTQAMMPTMKLSQFKNVIVGARVSPSGNPVRQPGDIEGLSQPLEPAANSKVEIVIDTQS